MADVAAATKQQQHLSIHGGSLISELKSLFSVVKNRKTMAFAYGFMFAFVAFTAFLAFNPSPNSSAPWFTNIFTIGAGSSSSSIFSYFMPNNINTTSSSSSSTATTTEQVQNNTRSTDLSSTVQNRTQFPTSDSVTKPDALQANRSSAFSDDKVPPSSSNSSVVNSSWPGQAQTLNQARVEAPISPVKANHSVNSSVTSDSLKPTNKSANSSVNYGSPAPTNQSAKTSGSKAPMNQTANSPVNGAPTTQSASSSVNSGSPAPKNQITNSSANSVSPAKGDGVTVKKEEKDAESNSTASLSEKQSSSGSKQNNSIDDLVRNMMNCNLFDGEWVKDELYPLYKPGSCSLIDEQFNCITNGRPDKDYQKYKWKPNGCTIPRLNPANMLNMLTGKRLVFVGDSLNRNMWESLVCMLKGAVKDQSKVFEANGRHHFRGEASYSFIFKDYNCTVEFFVSPFLVQEWEMPDKNGTKKETLRLDLVGRSADQYKTADIIIFNTGHWWTHEKTSKGKDYYQEGSHVYDDLNVLEAFRKALTTWARWVDAHINPAKSQVFFRGYSATHFSGGQWNSGGACDHEVEPIKNATYLQQYPSKMLVLEKVLKGMKTHVAYLNVTQMTDYRKDGHPSMYRKQNIPASERKSPLLYQDCSHWCLPGVPDAWNEILYAELLLHDYQNRQVQKRHR